MKIVAISGSPVKGGNLDKTVQAVAEASGLDYEMLNLSKYRVNPCLGCLKCVETNHCIQKDDYSDILEAKIKNADAVIIAGYPTFASTDARTKTFCERTYSLRHRKVLLKGKPAIVVAGGYKANQAVEEWLKLFCKAQGMEVVGSMQTCGHPTCLACGYGEECEISNVKLLYGEGAKIEPHMFKNFDNDPELVAKSKQLGEALRDRLK
ncbi:flavodoxin family protein [Dethiobacter alkaliphilus]|uniref:NADPH-dependent FMN reductase n=1 Tax=Dethiobacter alkaliphilus AHT 1 TaxID=555088 RepID=C0GFM3_DETAL|nr:flavodoxin family protein [Dethiobacter alkaliphilus]EEG77983.1 NADPH-dependent FMN reductase [Dethiobacter alkaliphilus AHT 1]